MAKFARKIGFINQVEKEPGLFENETVERSYTGDILQDVRRWNNVEKVNDDLTLGNRFSIIADGYILDKDGTTIGQTGPLKIPKDAVG